MGVGIALIALGWAGADDSNLSKGRFFGRVKTSAGLTVGSIGGGATGLR